MYPNPSQQLPFDASQPDPRLMMQIDMNNPPFVPHYQCEPWMMQYAPYIAAVLMVEIQSGAGRTALRTFAFNQLASNHWQNKDFAELFGATMDYVALAISNRRFHSPDDAAIQLVPSIVSMAVAANVRDFPELARWFPQNEAPAVNDAIMRMDSLRNQLIGFRQANPVFGYGVQRGGGQQQQNTRMQQMQMMQMNNRPDMGMGGQMNRQPLQNLGRGLGSAGVATLSGRPNPPTPVHTPVSNQITSPYSRMLEKDRNTQPAAPIPSLTQPFSPRTERIMDQTTPVPEFQPNQPSLESDGSFVVPTFMSTYAWKPSVQQPYRPIYQPATEDRFHRISAEGVVTIETQRKHPADMDYEKHNVANVFGKPREGVQYDMARAGELFTKAASDLTEQMNWAGQAKRLGDTEEGRDAQAKADEDRTVVIVQDDWISDISEAGLMLHVGMRRLAKCIDGTEPDVFRMFGYLSDPVICLSDQSAYLRRVSDSRTYRELAEKLATVEEGDDVALVEAISRRAVVMLNRVLSLNLSIPSSVFSLDKDFDPETIHDLEEAIEQQFGPVFLDAYRAKQASHIQSIFQSLESTEAEESLRASFFNDYVFPEGKKPWIALLTARYSFTTLNIYAHDLGFDIDSDTGSLLTQDIAGDLYTVVVNLFTNQPNKRPFYRHLFQTNDGLILEVTRGDIGQDAYLISRAPAVWIG